MQIHNEYAELLERRSRLESELETVKEKLKELEPQVLDWFAQQGIKNVRLEDGRSLHLRRELWASRAEGVSPYELVQMMQAAGFPEFVPQRLDVQRLSAFCRERERDGKVAVPPGLENAIAVREVFKIGSRRGSGNRPGPENGDENG